MGLNYFQRLDDEALTISKPMITKVTDFCHFNHILSRNIMTVARCPSSNYFLAKRLYKQFSLEH
jgi:hypothetical protein